MLSDRHCQLLTAYVDGRLSQRHREEVQRLLEKSPAARVLLRQLQDNIQRLQDLPRHALGPEFAAQVMSRIEVEQQPAPVPSVPSFEPSSKPLPLPNWIGLAVAAALLLAVTATSYFYNSWKKTPDLEPERSLTLVDFDRAAFQDQLALELKKGKGKGVHLDLTYQDGPQAVERLRLAFEQNGIKLLPGPLNGSGDLLVFAENISADELGGIVSQLSAEEQKSHQFDVPQFQPFTDKERGHVARLLGLRTLENENDLFKNIIETPSKNQRPAPKSTTPTPMAKDRVAIVLAGAGGAGQGTPAIRDFLANRTNPRPGTFRVVLVLRPASA